MHSIIARTRRLLERARWKREGWDRPSPVDIVEDQLDSHDLVALHFSKIGPGGKAKTPATLPDEEGNVEYTDPQPAGGFKVGINPETAFDTPAGVYGYYLTDQTYRKWFESGRPPTFATGRPWAYVITPKSLRGVLRLTPQGEAKGFGRSGLRATVERIVNRESDLVLQAMRAKGEGDQFPRNVDPGQRIEAFIDTDYFQSIQRESKHDTPFAVAWNLLRHVSHEAGNGARTWSRLIREHLGGAKGTKAVFDNGSGTLHENEPWQAAFYDTSHLEVETVVRNPFEWQETPHLPPGGDDGEGSVYEAFDQRGLSDILDKFDFSWFGDGITLINVAEWLEGRPDIVKVLRTLTPTRSDTVSARVKISKSHIDGFSIDHVRVSGITLSPRMLKTLDFGFSEFEVCTFTSSGDGPDRDLPSLNSNYYTDCRFEVETLPNDERVEQEVREALRSSDEMELSNSSIDYFNEVLGFELSSHVHETSISRIDRCELTLG